MGAPRRLFTAPATAGWDVTPDGKKFLLSVLPGGAGQTPITVVLNWQADLRK
jgi:hypothetical protein